MATTRHMITTEAHGTTGGTYFDDRLLIGDLENAVLVKILLYHGAYLNSLTMYYACDHVPVGRGGKSGTKVEIDLESGEYITMITGVISNNVIAKPKFVTNKGTVFGPYGEGGGPGSGLQSFTLNPVDMVSAQLAPRMGLLYLSGNACGTHVRQLRATFGLYTVEPTQSSNVKFEERVPTTISSNTISLSSFGRNIMSPVITLEVGPFAVVFHAYEATLCRIPFFRAALQGEFREAAEKKVSLPEEDPEAFCALLEHLYTGSYTYTYDAGTTVVVGGAPVTDLAEGCYHVCVYAVAFRYDWQPLVEDAVSNFLAVLPKLVGMDVVRLWKAAYENELTIAVCAGEGRLQAFQKVLPGLLKGLYAAEAEEMESTLAELPAFASDIIKLLVAGSEQ